MEVPFLRFSAISSLDDKVSAVNDIEISVLWQLRNNVEWSFNIESELFVKFSLLWLFWIFVSIDDIPLLVNLTMFGPYNNVSVFIIKTSMDIQNLSFLIHNEW